MVRLVKRLRRAAGQHSSGDSAGGRVHLLGSPAPARYLAHSARLRHGSGCRRARQPQRAASVVRKALGRAAGGVTRPRLYASRRCWAYRLPSSSRWRSWKPPASTSSRFARFSTTPTAVHISPGTSRAEFVGCGREITLRGGSHYAFAGSTRGMIGWSTRSALSGVVTLRILLLAQFLPVSGVRNGTSGTCAKTGSQVPRRHPARFRHRRRAGGRPSPTASGWCGSVRRPRDSQPSTAIRRARTPCPAGSDRQSGDPPELAAKRFDVVHAQTGSSTVHWARQPAPVCRWS